MVHIKSKEKTTSKEPKDKKDLGKRKSIIFYENEYPELCKQLGLSKTAKNREISNAIRKKLGMQELTITITSKRKEVIEKLGLKEDATQKEINDAVLELDLE